MKIEIETAQRMDDFDGELEEPRMRHFVARVEIEFQARKDGEPTRSCMSACGTARARLLNKPGGDVLSVTLIGRQDRGDALAARRPSASPKFDQEVCGLTPVQSKMISGAGSLAVQLWWDAQETLDEEEWL